MKKLTMAVFAAMFITSCAETRSHGGPEPIPGSITYGGTPRTKLQKAPIGSTLSHYFEGPSGERIVEIYRVMPDRSLKLVSRRRSFTGFPEP